MSNPAILLTIVTIIVAILAAGGLYYLSGQKLRVRTDDTPVPPLEETTQPEGSDRRATILDKLAEISSSPRHRERTAQMFSSYLDRELEKQKSEISVQYEQAIRKKQKELTEASQKIDRLGQEFKTTYEKYQKVTAEKTQTETVVRSMAEGIVVVNNKGEVLLMNPAAEKLIGEDTKSGSIFSNPKGGRLISMVKEGAGSAGKEIELLSENDNTKRVLRASSAVIENESGQTIGMVSVLTDVTKQRELEEMKSRFLSTVSHELRTPLVTIQKAIELIHRQTGRLTPDQEKFIDIAERNLQSLSRLINDLLDMQKIEAGKLEMIYTPARIQEVIRTVVENLSHWGQSKGVKIENRAPAELPEVEIDAQRIGQVLINLIGNAVKFTPSGGSITASAKQKQGLIEVSVADTGVGISKEDLGKVFQRFQQVGERTSSDIAGTGLGLSIAKEIVQLHGGTIWVESELNKGTTFLFTLPMHREPSAQGG